MLNSTFIPLLLILINTVVYFGLPENLKFFGMKDNEAIKDGEFYRLFTAIFLHSDFLHLLSNCYGIFIFSDLINRTGLIWFLGIYIISGIIGNIFSFLFNPFPSLGASGAVFGLIGAFFLLSGFSLNILVYIIISLVYAGMPGSRIDFFAHLGGLISGLIGGILLIST
jgi:rhomboid protease GluP